MPTGQIKSIADKYDLSTTTVERMWNRCKDRVDKGDKSDDAYYGSVYECTRRAAKAASEANKANEGEG